jgi:acyl-CoA-binding protein
MSSSAYVIRRLHTRPGSFANVCTIKLYAYAKVAEGKDFSKAEKPGMFNLAVRFPSLPRNTPNSTPSVIYSDP